MYSRLLYEVGSRGSLVSDRASAIFGATPDKERVLVGPPLGALISAGHQPLHAVLGFSYSIHPPTTQRYHYLTQAL